MFRDFGDGVRAPETAFGFNLGAYCFVPVHRLYRDISGGTVSQGQSPINFAEDVIRYTSLGALYEVPVGHVIRYAKAACLARVSTVRGRKVLNLSLEPFL